MRGFFLSGFEFSLALQCRYLIPLLKFVENESYMVRVMAGIENIFILELLFHIVRIEGKPFCCNRFSNLDLVSQSD